MYRSLLIPVSQKLVVQILLNTQFHTVLSTFGRDILIWSSQMHSFDCKQPTCWVNSLFVSSIHFKVSWLDRKMVSKELYN